MDWRLFISTFGLIFLAELGDKTQLTAMMRASTCDSAKWVVFAGASAALVTSTLIAVLAGSMITKVIPESVIKILAAIFFIIMGGWILVEQLRPAKPTAVPAAVAPAVVPSTGVYRFVLNLAQQFETAAHRDYQTLAERSSDPVLQSLFTRLASEEAAHVQALTGVNTAHADALDKPHASDRLPSAADLHHDVAAGSGDILAHAIEHETATACFYRELARTCLFPGLKTLFQDLASQEEAHVRMLTEAKARIS